MRVGVVRVVVDAEHDGEVRIGRGRGDDDLLRARVEVLLRALAVGEEAGRLEHDVDAEVAPRQRGRVALGEHLHLLAAGADDAVAELDLARERPEHRVVPQEVGHRLRVAEVVDRDDLDVRAELLLRAEEVAADPAEAVDADPGCHAVSRLRRQGAFAPSLVAAGGDEPQPREAGGAGLRLAGVGRTVVAQAVPRCSLVADVSAGGGTVLRTGPDQSGVSGERPA